MNHYTGWLYPTFLWGATFENLVDMALIHEEEKGANAQDNKGDPEKAQQQQKKGSKDNKGSEKRKCHNCGIPSHLKKDCRKKKRTGCFQCGEAGYMIKDFPRRQEQGQGQRT